MTTSSAVHRSCLRLIATAVIAVAIVATTYAHEAENVVLFDGKTLNGWTTQEGKPVAGGWEVADGAIHLRSGKSSVGNILTAREYGDFDLSFEWKIATGGNGGLKYRVRDYGGKLRGCEYQIIDDAHYGNEIAAKTSSGAIYDLYEPMQEKQLRPPGEFNSARIVVRNNRVQHWLNGRLIVSATIGSADWVARLAKSKFVEFDKFALNERGRLMLTDHGSEAWYRNLQFRPLEAPNGKSKSVAITEQHGN